MTAFNTVRFKVKPGREQEFLDAHKKVQANWPGLKHANMIQTGERTFCKNGVIWMHLRTRDLIWLQRLIHFAALLKTLVEVWGLRIRFLGRLYLHLNSHAAMSAIGP